MTKKKDELKKQTDDGIELKVVYSEVDTLGVKRSAPAEFPFTRGIHSNMYRGRPWTIRQYAGFGTVEETNKRFKYLTETGATGLSTAFDLPTQMGIDSDDPRAVGEVGRTGVAIDSVEDMERLFDGISLEKISTSMTINATAHILLAFYLVVAERRKIDWKDLNGTVQNDLLKEFIARGTYIYPPQHSIKVVADIVEFCTNQVPRWNPVSISGYHIREAGSTAAQEVAFTILNGLTYVDEVLTRGLTIDQFAPRLAFFMNCHNNFFEEIAKFRAARTLWAKLIKDRYQPKNPKALLFRFHTQTAGSSLTALQPMNNVVRTSYQALAAVLGGTQSLHTNSFDEALSLPTEESAKLALRTQQVLAEETGVADVVDPLGGSFFVEKLTDDLEKTALCIIQDIEGKGGMIKAISEGLPQKMIEESSYRYQLEVEKGDRKVVGVNSFCDELDDLKSVPVTFKLDAGLEKAQLMALGDFKKRRDQSNVKKSLEELSKVATNGGNIMESVIACARANTTLGEISDELRKIYGVFKQQS